MMATQPALTSAATHSKRILVVMMQPPGCSGVQALIFNKWLPFLESHGWEFHFAGPSPHLFSVLTEDLDYPAERLHYSTDVSWSKRFSVLKNRHGKRSFSYLCFGVLQLLASRLETLLAHNSEAYLLRGIERSVRRAEAQCSFDLIAGKQPDFKVLELVSGLARELSKPFLALIDDPYGARDESGFYPTKPELQSAILARACGAVFMSPLTRDRYVNAGLIAAEKAHQITDSFSELPELYRSGCSQLAPSLSADKTLQCLQFVYLGMLPEWRPIEPLLEAMQQLLATGDGGPPPFRLSIYGFVYAAARHRIQTDPCLAAVIHCHPMVSYTESHWLAEDADVQLVVIGPRHLDNYPSKFFDYLAHKKIVLVLGPPQNPLRTIVEHLGVGLYVDGKDPQAIAQALQTIQFDRRRYEDAYSANADAISAYAARNVAERFCQLLETAMAWHKRTRALG